MVKRPSNPAFPPIFPKRSKAGKRQLLAFTPLLLLVYRIHFGFYAFCLSLKHGFNFLNPGGARHPGPLEIGLIPGRSIPAARSGSSGQLP